MKNYNTYQIVSFLVIAGCVFFFGWWGLIAMIPFNYVDVAQYFKLPGYRKIRQVYYLYLYKGVVDSKISNLKGVASYLLLLEFTFNPIYEEKYLEIGREKFGKWMPVYIYESVIGKSEQITDPELQALMQEANSPEFKDIADRMNYEDTQQEIKKWNEKPESRP